MTVTAIVSDIMLLNNIVYRATIQLDSQSSLNHKRYEIARPEGLELRVNRISYRPKGVELNLDKVGKAVDLCSRSEQSQFVYLIAELSGAGFNMRISNTYVFIPCTILNRCWADEFGVFKIQCPAP